MADVDSVWYILRLCSGLGPLQGPRYQASRRAELALDDGIGYVASPYRVYLCFHGTYSSINVSPIHIQNVVTEFS